MLNSVQVFIALLAMVFVLNSDSSHEVDLLLDNTRSTANPNASWALLIEQQPERALAALAQSESPYWLRIAAKAGSVKAQYRLAAQQHSSQQQQHDWLTLAARNGLAEAQIDLYQQLKQSDPVKAENWLTEAAVNNADGALLLAKLKWQQQKYKQSGQYFSRASQMGSKRAEEFQQAIGDSHSVLASVVASERCYQQLLFVATSLDNLLQAYQFKQQYQQDSQFRNLPVCLGRTLFYAPQVLSCVNADPDDERLSCDESYLARELQNQKFTHLIVLGNKGKANVNNGIMYLDQTDSYQVFIHELAHFAGFVDEYPLSAELAAQFCHPDSDIPNLMISETGTTPGYPPQWSMAGANKLLQARTCDNSDYQAYKAIDQFTFMEFYDEGVIPSLYLTLWEQQLSDPRQMLPAYINLAQAAEQAGNNSLKHYWWQRYLDFQQGNKS